MFKMVKEGWLEQCQEKELQPFPFCKSEWRTKIVISLPGREQLLEELHMGHPGVGSMNSLNSLA